VDFKPISVRSTTNGSRVQLCEKKFQMTGAATWKLCWPNQVPIRGTSISRCCGDV